jgi:hypothetical protein
VSPEASAGVTQLAALAIGDQVAHVSSRRRGASKLASVSQRERSAERIEP